MTAGTKLPDQRQKTVLLTAVAANKRSASLCKFPNPIPIGQCEGDQRTPGHAVIGLQERSPKFKEPDYL